MPNAIAVRAIGLPSVPMAAMAPARPKFEASPCCENRPFDAVREIV
jgi:hypothetical protein